MAFSSPLQKLMLQLIIFSMGALLFLSPVLEPDLGWHLRVGEHIINYGVPQTDIFSFSNPNYPYVYHSWLAEVILFVGYSKLGLWGVNLIYSTLGGFVFLALFNKRNIGAGPLILLTFLLGALIVYATGLRTQNFTLAGLALVYFIWEKYKSKEAKMLWLIPFVFAIWVNLHGGFLLGLGFFSLLVLVEVSDAVLKSNKIKRAELTKLKKRVGLLTLLPLISGVAALISPYGIRSYTQAYLMATNTFTSTFNEDWSPLIRAGGNTYLFGIALVVLSLFTLHSIKTSQKHKTLIFTLLLLSLKMNRFSLALLVVLIPSFVTALDQYNPNKLLKKAHSVHRAAGMIILFILLALQVGSIAKINPIYKSEALYAEKANKPYQQPFKAVEYLKSNDTPDNLLSHFAWGGYLIWKYPEKKVFIDGRMDNFFINGESFAKTYFDILSLKPNWSSSMAIYDINSVLLHPSTPLVQHLKTDNRWETVFEEAESIILVRKPT